MVRLRFVLNYNVFSLRLVLNYRLCVCVSQACLELQILCVCVSQACLELQVFFSGLSWTTDFFGSQSQACFKLRFFCQACLELQIFLWLVLNYRVFCLVWLELQNLLWITNTVHPVGSVVVQGSVGRLIGGLGRRILRKRLSSVAANHRLEEGEL